VSRYIKKDFVINDPCREKTATRENPFPMGKFQATSLAMKNGSIYELIIKSNIVVQIKE
jgi:hypothetical protein